jgi:hypothetical protein
MQSPLGFKVLKRFLILNRFIVSFFYIALKQRLKISEDSNISVQHTHARARAHTHTHTQTHTHNLTILIFIFIIK